MRTCTRSPRELPQDGRGDLRASGVLHAHEQHLGRRPGSRCGTRARASSRSAANAAVRDGSAAAARPFGEQLVALAHVAVDGLAAEDAAEALGEVVDDPRELRLGIRRRGSSRSTSSTRSACRGRGSTRPRRPSGCRMHDPSSAGPSCGGSPSAAAARARRRGGRPARDRPGSPNAARMRIRVGSASRQLRAPAPSHP